MVLFLNNCYLSNQFHLNLLEKIPIYFRVSYPWCRFQDFTYSKSTSSHFVWKDLPIYFRVSCPWFCFENFTYPTNFISPLLTRSRQCISGFITHGFVQFFSYPIKNLRTPKMKLMQSSSWFTWAGAGSASLHLKARCAVPLFGRVLSATHNQQRYAPGNSRFLWISPMSKFTAKFRLSMRQLLSWPTCLRSCANLPSSCPQLCFQTVGGARPLQLILNQWVFRGKDGELWWVRIRVVNQLVRLIMMSWSRVVSC